MPVPAIGVIGAVAGPAMKALAWIGRGFGKMGRSPLFVDFVDGAIAGGRNAASRNLGGNSGNNQRVGKGAVSSSDATGYSSEGGNTNLMLYVGGLVVLLLVMKK